MSTDYRPHSRACGIRNHEHGPDCHPNCPTCHGKPIAAAPKRHYLSLTDEEIAYVLELGHPINGEFGPGFLRICRENSPAAFDAIQQRWASQII